MLAMMIQTQAAEQRRARAKRHLVLCKDAGNEARVMRLLRCGAVSVELMAECRADHECMRAELRRPERLPECHCLRGHVGRVAIEAVLLVPVCRHIKAHRCQRR